MPKTFASSGPYTSELTEKWKKKSPFGPFEVWKVDEVNHRPHPFVIGPKHVDYASDHCGGMLGRNVVGRIPCDHCKRPASEHEYDVVLVLKLTRNSKNSEAAAVLKPLCDEMKADGIDGITFVDTPEKYRIQK